jgi:hypothetical protein
MPWFRRGDDRPTAADAPPPVAPVSAPAKGLLPAPAGSACTEQGCGRPAVHTCAYVDRRRRACGTAWCEEHLVDTDIGGFCRRHGPVMRALARHEQGEGIAPDIDNRAPSLVQWVANDIGPDAIAMLERLRGPRTDLDIIADPLDVVLMGTPRTRQWQRSWKISDQTGTAVKLAISVDEALDSEVVVRVDAEAIGRIVPPWIAERGKQLPPEIDAQWRKAFRDAVLGAMWTAASRRESYVQSHP